MTDAAFERDLRAYLDGSAPTDVPASLGLKIAALSDSDGRRSTWFDLVASFATAGVALVLVLALAFVAVVSLPRSADSPGGDGGHRLLSWRTEVAVLEANSISVEVGGKSFHAPSDAVGKANPGAEGNRSLQLQWQEHGVPMNLDFNIRTDGSSWWVSEILSSDGTSAVNWISYGGVSDAPLFAAPPGESFRGDIELDATGGRAHGHLSIEDMRLSAFPTDTTNADPCTRVAAAPQPEGEPAPDAVEILAGYGVGLGMEAREVGSVLTGHGFCHSYRLEYGLGDNRGYSQIWCVPPPGRVKELAFGSGGDVIAFVDATEEAPALIPFVNVGC